MKKVNIPLMIQDVQAIFDEGGNKYVEGFNAERPYFLDGPVTDDVAVLDFDPDTGSLVPGVRYDPGNIVGFYVDAEGRNLRNWFSQEVAVDQFQWMLQESPEFIPLCAFAIVLRTIDLFKYDRNNDGNSNHVNVLGRPLKWAFEGSQLLIVPRAGLDANAFYQRASHSLQFFFTLSERSGRRLVYTALSRDIVAHETGHAIIDGIAPDLCDAYTPESIAIHEALADLTAVLLAFGSNGLSHLVLDQEDGHIEKPTHFSNIAEELAAVVGRGHGLRNLLSKVNLTPGTDEYVSSLQPHALGEVLSCTLYAVMLKLYDRERNKYVARAETMDAKRQAWGIALANAAMRFKQLIFRGLDYLPPGEATFLTYLRAVLAADRVAYPGDTDLRQWLIDEALTRGIVQDASELSIDSLEIKLTPMHVEDLCRSDWASYNYIQDNRGKLGIGKNTSFKIYPRLDVVKINYNWTTSHECIFKVSWSQLEDNMLDADGFPSQRRIHVGTTLVFNRDTGEGLVALSSAPVKRESTDSNIKVNSISKSEYDEQKLHRDEFLQYLVDRNLLHPTERLVGPDGHVLPMAIEADIVNDVLRVHNTLNLVYLRGE